MKKSNVLKPLLLLLLSVLIANCGHVTVTDKQVCADLGIYGAQCAHTLIELREYLSKPEWDAKRTGWMCMSADDYSDSEDSLDELCRTTNACNYETKQEINRIKAKMSPLKDAAKDAVINQ